MPATHGPTAYASELAAVRAAERDGGWVESAVWAGAFVWAVVADSVDRARRLLCDRPLRGLGLLTPQGVLSSSPLEGGPWASLVPTAGGVASLASAVDPHELATLVPHSTPDQVAEALTATYTQARNTS